MCSKLIRLLLGAFLSTHAFHVHQLEKTRGSRDLVFVHTPYNFGHTIENVALFSDDIDDINTKVDFIDSMGGFATSKGGLTWDRVNKIKQPNGEVWGHNNPDLQGNSSVGCPYYYTPQKYWSKELQEKYIGTNKIFGVLRDPYEHLVALFRGNIPGYGSDSTDSYFETCDINRVIKQAIKQYIAGDKFMSACTFLPQAEYFDGPYGISIPIDNRRFPDSMNEVFQEHGYGNLHIKGEDVMHVVGCQNAWAGDLDAETKSLIRQVYARDFELLCKHFGYCDDEENTCLTHIPSMCPLTHYTWVWDNSSTLVHEGKYVQKKQPSPPTPEEVQIQKRVSTRFSGVPLDIRGFGETFKGYEPACSSDLCMRTLKTIVKTNR